MAETRINEMAKIIINSIDERKGEDIVAIDISNVTVIADMFIIASGNNINQIQRISDEIDEKLAKAGFEVKQIEGYETANWILMDCGDIIVHIFNKENRLFYDLERIWADGKKIDLDILTKNQ